MWLTGLALVVLACTEEGTAQAVPSLVSQQEIRYLNLAGEETTVKLQLADSAWVLTVTNPNGTWQQKELLPMHHPLDQRPATMVHLELQANGFGIDASYPVLNLKEQVHLVFEHLPDAKPTECPLQLSRFKRTQQHNDARGKPRSGLLVDYNTGVARIFALEGQMPGTPSHPIGLLPQPRSFCQMPSALEWIPALDVPKVR